MCLRESVTVPGRAHASRSANAADPAVTPVNMISEKIMLRSCVDFITVNYANQV